MLSIHLRNTYKKEIFTTLIFFQVFYFSFGFYSIWGQFFINSFLSIYVTAELLRKITDLLVLFGMPFIAIDSIMLVRFSGETVGKKPGRALLLSLLLFHTLLIFGIGYIFVEYRQVSTFTAVKYYYLFINFFFTVLSSLILIGAKKRNISLLFSDRRWMAIALSSFMIAQSIFLLFYNENLSVALLFILAYFASGSFIPLYLRYLADLSVFLPKSDNSDSFERFCRKYEISKRETEIIHEICKGLSNQQIADKLFISLQTVKDHTHRIYFKTECNSRAQLMRMVNESSL
jgi:DNA-binding CsgD family transcriptional regulator